MFIGYTMLSRYNGKLTLLRRVVQLTVAHAGIEPATSVLLTPRSNQLS